MRLKHEIHPARNFDQPWPKLIVEKKLGLHRSVPSFSLLFLFTVFGAAKAQENSFAYQVAPQECLFFSSRTDFQPTP